VLLLKSRFSIARGVAVVLAMGLCGATPAPTPTSDPQAGQIFKAARDHWGDGNYPRYVTYTVGISYVRDGKLTAFHYQTYEDLRRNLVYARAFSAEEEAHPRTPSGTSIVAGSLNGQGGVPVNHDRADDPVGTLALGINQDYRLSRTPRSIRALTVASDVANSSNLPIIGSSGIAPHDYTVRLIETTTENGVPVAHLGLTPRRDPHQYIVRDLWVNTATSVVLRARLSENFNRGPLHGVSWIVRYRQIDGAPYIASETAEAPVTYDENETLAKVTIRFTNVKGVDQLAWRDAVGLEPDPAVTDP
jgi:hypothetical protein